MHEVWLRRGRPASELYAIRCGTSAADRARTTTGAESESAKEDRSRSKLVVDFAGRTLRPDALEVLTARERDVVELMAGKLADDAPDVLLCGFWLLAGGRESPRSAGGVRPWCDRSPILTTRPACPNARSASRCRSRRGSARRRPLARGDRRACCPRRASRRSPARSRARRRKRRDRTRRTSTGCRGRETAGG